jgi:hypothetical protein
LPPPTRGRCLGLGCPARLQVVAGTLQLAEDGRVGVGLQAQDGRLHRHVGHGLGGQHVDGAVGRRVHEGTDDHLVALYGELVDPPLGRCHGPVGCLLVGLGGRQGRAGVLQGCELVAHVAVEIVERCHHVALGRP